jgi:protease-4
MWHELTLLKEKMPLIVSMGNYAASGGYYISCPADAIYADHTTLTGSIGVFALYPNLGGALKKNLGITVDGVNTNKYSDLGTPFRSPSAAEAAWFQNYVADTSSTFIGRVAQGRHMTTEAVDNIGQGRVWAGANALEIGLIDGYGGIKEAIALAADRGGVADDFRVWEVAPAPTGLAAIFSGFSARIQGLVRNAVLRDEMGGAFVEYDNLRRIIEEDEVQARLPYVINVR